MLILDGNYMKTKTDAHRYLKEQLDLPDYYGNNLDALYDCLTEMGELTVIFCNISQEDSYPQKIVKVFRQAEKENSCLQVIVD